MILAHGEAESAVDTATAKPVGLPAMHYLLTELIRPSVAGGKKPILPSIGTALCLLLIRGLVMRQALAYSFHER
jgi:hypothetical protein